MTPVLFPAALHNHMILVYLFHVEADVERARRIAATVQNQLLEGSTSAPAADPITQAAPRQVSPLTARELEVLRLLAWGLDAAETATKLHISSHTVRNHFSNARGKMQAKTKLGAVLAAQCLGLL